jgi:hypothetical protein
LFWAAAYAQRRYTYSKEKKVTVMKQQKYFYSTGFV